MPAEIVIRPEIKIRAYCKDGICCVEAIVPTQYGDLCLKGSYPIAKAIAAIRAWYQRQGLATPPTVESGFLGGISKKARQLAGKVAQAAALAPVIRSVQEIQKNPILARAVGLTTAVIPGAGSAQVAAKAAFNLVQKAAGGAPAAIGQLSRLKSLVQMGNPQAANAWRLVQNAHKAIQQKKPIDMLKGLGATAIDQINAPLQQAAQAVAMKNQILGYLPPHLRPYVDAAIAQVPGATQVQQAAAVAPVAQAFASRFPPVASGGVVMDPAAYAAGYYGC